MPRQPEYFVPPLAKSTRPPEPGEPGYVAPAKPGGPEDPLAEHRELLPEAQRFLADNRRLYCCADAEVSARH